VATFKRILVAIDGSPLSAQATDVAAGLATALGAEVAFVYVIEPGETVAPAGGMPADELRKVVQQEGHSVLEAAASRVHVEPPPWRFLKEGKPAAEIVAAAREWGADLIVIGTHGRSGLGRVVLGSIAEAVVHAAPCPVLLARGGAAT
jgi:nucleotide-binding universal stress UspA family protein